MLSMSYLQLHLIMCPIHQPWGSGLFCCSQRGCRYPCCCENACHPRMLQRLVAVKCVNSIGYITVYFAWIIPASRVWAGLLEQAPDVTLWSLLPYDSPELPCCYSPMSLSCPCFQCTCIQFHSFLTSFTNESGTMAMWPLIMYYGT